MFRKLILTLITMSILYAPALWTVTNQLAHKKMPAWQKKALSKKISYKKREKKKAELEEKRVRWTFLMLFTMISGAQIAEIYNKSPVSETKQKPTVKKQKIVSCSTIRKRDFSILTPFSENSSLQVGVMVEDNAKIRACLINSKNKKFLQKTYTIDYSEVAMERPGVITYKPNLKKWLHPNIGPTMEKHKEDMLPNAEKFYDASIQSLQLKTRLPLLIGNYPYTRMEYDPKTLIPKAIIIQETWRKWLEIQSVSHEATHQQQFENKPFLNKLEKRIASLKNKSLQSIIALNLEINARIIGALNFALLTGENQMPTYVKQAYRSLSRELKIHHNKKMQLFDESAFCNYQTSFCWNNHMNDHFDTDMRINIANIAHNFMGYFNKKYKILLKKPY